MAKRQKKLSKSLWLTIFWVAVTSLFILIIAVLLRGRDIALLNPKGFVAHEQFRLLIISTTIMLVFAALVMFFIYFFAWKYREMEEESVPDPAAGRNRKLQFTAWASPFVIFVILASIMLPATQKLEPNKVLASDADPVTIQVVALRWKWLFIYPEQKIATVNFVQIPIDSPVTFELTADEAPMNSFWIPHLGGMLYAMTGHVNPLNLKATELGDYSGGAAEVNGRGLAGMRFTTRVSTRSDFDSWVDGVRYSAGRLDASEYEKLLEPSEYDSVAYYSHAGPEVFNAVLGKYADSHAHAADYSEHSKTEAEGH